MSTYFACPAFLSGGQQDPDILKLFPNKLQN